MSRFLLYIYKENVIDSIYRNVQFKSPNGYWAEIRNMDGYYYGVGALTKNVAFKKIPRLLKGIKCAFEISKKNDAVYRKSATSYVEIHFLKIKKINKYSKRNNV